ncbi:spexin prohormone 2 isoform X3 [Scyliorhinus canicula]|uniref:spexin prohormone 2 isoform X3 n=1 Tax=Scyliorhinus canicula TaxID=7830 RepID=UPI0018F5CB78|nr:spexin prohormone 2 isoform X3 [Scyliorhinus canicula]
MTTSGTEGTERIHEGIQLPELVLLSSSQNSQPFDALSSQDTQFTSDTVDLTDVEAMEIDCGQHDYRNEVQMVLQSVSKREDVDNSESGQHLDDACTESPESDEGGLEDEIMEEEQELCPFSQPSPPRPHSQFHSHYVHLLSSFAGDNGNTSIMPLAPMGNWTQEHGLPHQMRMIPVIKGPLISSNVSVGKYNSTGSHTRQPSGATQPPCSPTHTEDCCTGVTASSKNNMELPEQSAEIREAVASIATDSKTDSPISDVLTDEINRQISPQRHLSVEQRSPLRGSSSPSVLYQLKGNTQMLVINSTNPGQLKAVHVLPPGQLMDNKAQCVQFNSLVGSMENTAMHPGEVAGFLGKVLPMSTPQSSGLNIQQLQHASGGPIPENGSLASEASAHIPSTISLTRLPIMTTDSRSKKPCNCTKSQCLKLYCDCFANGEFCSNCNCTNCFNNFEHEAERFKAIKACLDRNPEAFRPKIGKGILGEIKLRHNKGCNCKRSGCLKNYCECYEAKIMCSSICKCIGCRNYEESPERRTLMSIPDHSDMGICQPRTKLFPEIFNYSKQVKVNQERHPFTFVTWDVIDATCGCLLAQAEEAEKAYHSLSVAEHMILEEFGRCFAQILHLAWKSKEWQCL